MIRPEMEQEPTNKHYTVKKGNRTDFLFCCLGESILTDILIGYKIYRWLDKMFARSV